jgi:mRNA interferase RelE/StbE
MALQEFCSLDGSVKKLVKKQLDKLKTSPLLGEELGNKNGYDLTGYRKMYACKKQIRIVYSVVENVLLVNIIAIGKREELEVYKTASERV